VPYASQPIEFDGELSGAVMFKFLTNVNTDTKEFIEFYFQIILYSYQCKSSMNCLNEATALRTIGNNRSPCKTPFSPPLGSAPCSSGCRSAF
jgi:hypothetical protein